MRTRCCLLCRSLLWIHEAVAVVVCVGLCVGVYWCVQGEVSVQRMEARGGSRSLFVLRLIAKNRKWISGSMVINTPAPSPPSPPISPSPTPCSHHTNAESNEAQEGSESATCTQIRPLPELGVPVVWGTHTGFHVCRTAHNSTLNFVWLCGNWPCRLY